MTIPYKIAVLAYIFNDAGQILLLHRKKPPNQDLYSPVGGKLEQSIGESPYACAQREIHEEVGIHLPLSDLRLLGLVSERAFPGAPNPTLTHNLNPNPSPPSALNTQHSALRTPHSPLSTQHPALSTPSPLTSHWLMFCFEVIRPLNFPARHIEEGRLEWFDLSALQHLNIPQTDRQVIWPLVQSHSILLGGQRRGDIFSVHIDCRDAENFTVTHEHPPAA